jgi:uncharacterized membrane protein YphA (DoxX/SURF4 family)
MKNNILFVLCLLTALMMINGGLNKFLNYMPMPDDLPVPLVNLMQAFQESRWLMPLIGIAEIVGGVLFILPKYRTLGALILLPVMVGIVLTHIFQEPSGLPVALVMLAILAWALYENRKKLLPIIGK